MHYNRIVTYFFCALHVVINFGCIFMHFIFYQFLFCVRCIWFSELHVCLTRCNGCEFCWFTMHMAQDNLFVYSIDTKAVCIHIIFHWKFLKGLISWSKWNDSFCHKLFKSTFIFIMQQTSTSIIRILCCCIQINITFVWANNQLSKCHSFRFHLCCHHHLLKSLIRVKNSFKFIRIFILLFLAFSF